MAGRPNGNGNGSGGRGSGGGKTGNGEFIAWLQATLASNDRRHADHEAQMKEMKAQHEDRMEMHERRMTEMERKRREDKAAHEAGMEEMRREHTERMDGLQKEQIQIRIQNGRLIRLVDDVAEGQKKLTQVVKEVHGRVERVEGGTGRKGRS